uniref:GPI mannosyltransferase 1-like n=1 Tax=Styela clava TaxID=7725 RepID=UPI00193A579D|nr:GPI mannosyltransferase 1-like [Styela clava]
MDISLQQLHLCAFFIRIGLIVYGEWQDKNLELKFTDVDYHVFTDAAQYVFNGESPYNRPTYRYSPLLAWMLVPCHIIHILWGKLVFISADLLAGWLIQNTMAINQDEGKLTKIALSIWLFNPITMTISSRGNAESIMSVLVLGTLYLLSKERLILAGIFFAISVHLKIFPLVIALAVYLFLGDGFEGRHNKLYVHEFLAILSPCGAVNVIKKVFSKERTYFFLSSVITFVLITFLFYFLYGHDFLEHAYFYHITRKDIRHNFSIYFYMLYTSSDWWLGLICFFNQVLVTLCLSVAFYKDLPFCTFLLVFSFVTFNKICTSQYFLWYLTILPLVIPGLANVNLFEIIAAVFLWGGGQGIWLASAYVLEFEGQRVFLYVWGASVLFFIINVIVIIWFMKRYVDFPSYMVRGVRHEQKTSKKRI